MAGMKINIKKSDRGMEGGGVLKPPIPQQTPATPADNNQKKQDNSASMPKWKGAYGGAEQKILGDTPAPVASMSNEDIWDRIKNASSAGH